MTWAQVLATGNGRLSYRLAIEGWPECFVTGSWIIPGELDSREYIACLSYQGLRINDRTYPSEGRADSSGMTFRLTPPRGTATSTGFSDPVSASLSVYPEPIAKLNVDLTSEATSWNVLPAIAQSGYYHIGTEAVYVEVGEATTITRQQWQSQAQAHWIGLVDEGFATYIYNRPKTMEGRRAYLYVYADGDSAAGGGTLIWRGYVSRPPRIAEDGVSWEIECLGITHALKQSVAAYDTAELRLAGLYFHSYATFSFFIKYGDTQSNIHKICGIFNPDGFIAEVNAAMETALTECDAGAETWASIRLEHDGNGKWFWVGYTKVTPGSTKTFIFGGSHITGVCDWNSKWQAKAAFPVVVAEGTVFERTIYVDDEPTSEPQVGEYEYHMELKFAFDPYCDEFDQQEYSYPVSHVANPLGYASWTIEGFPGFFESDDEDEKTEYPPWRLIVRNTDIASISSTLASVTLDNGGKPCWEAAPYFLDPTYNVTGTGTIEGVGYIDIEPRRSVELIPDGRGGFIPPVRDNLLAWATVCRNASYAGIMTDGIQLNISRTRIEGSVSDLRDALVADSIYANLGDSPFITDEDLATFPTPVGDTDITDRSWTFGRPVAVDRLLAEEVKLCGHLMVIESDGRIGIKPLQLPTDTLGVADTHVIDTTNTITPAGSYGMWPRIDPQADGIVTSLLIQQEYDYLEDKWMGQTFKMRDVNAISTHKNRGKANVEIKPWSRPQNPPVGKFDAARQFLAFNSFDYVTVVVRVPYKNFPILIGDMCVISSKFIPAGDGTRGVSRKGALCVGRTWNLDPASEDHGELTLWVLAETVYGYAPSAWIESQTSSGGNVWVLNLNSTVNEQWHTNNSGEIARHYVVGDTIIIREFNSASPTEVLGQITVIDSSTYQEVTVALDAAWTPGSSEWTLELQEHEDATSNMKKYTYVADGNKLLSDDTTYARRLA